jgi:hypothetical protein
MKISAIIQILSTFIVSIYDDTIQDVFVRLVFFSDDEVFWAQKPMARVAGDSAICQRH